MRIVLAVIATIAVVSTTAHAEFLGDRRGDEIAQTTPAEPTPSATMAKPAIPAVKPMSPVRLRAAASRSENADCAWTGKRTVQVLVRDDLIAAEGFFKFYNAFGCPTQHLSEAFSCTVDGLANTDAQALEARIDACWSDPSAQPNPAAATIVDESNPVPKNVPPEPKPDNSTAYPKR
jgi:hypothetical protein